MVRRRPARLREQRVAGRGDRLRFHRRYGHRDHRRLDSNPGQPLFQNADQVLLVPVRLCERDLDPCGRDGSAAALMAQLDAEPLDGQVACGQPSNHLHQQAADVGKRRFGILEARQVHRGIESRRCFGPLEHFRRSP